MAKNKISIQCKNIAPIENLNRELSLGSLKIGVFANNGSGKTFISRLFGLTNKSNELKLDEDEKSPTDKIISLGKNSGNFVFKITDKDGVLKENISIDIDRGKIPSIPNTEYIYHTFNQDYVDSNIRALNFDKNSEIEGFILGKVNIDLRDEEDKLSKIEKRGDELKSKIELEVSLYVIDKIDDIRDIKRLKLYKLLEPKNIINGVSRNKYNISKSFDELLDDYNKIKSVPENLKDIELINKVDIDTDLFNPVIIICLKEYSLSALSDEFKKKIKNKQGFIENGIELLGSSDSCPFCEQFLEDDAVRMIDKYNEYLNDVESQTLKIINTYKESLESIIKDVHSGEAVAVKRINEFNKYKTKYIPSSENIELNEIDTENIRNLIGDVIFLLDKKLLNIANRVDVSETLFVPLKESIIEVNEAIDNNNNEIESINQKKNKIGEENKTVRNALCKKAYNNLIDKHESDIYKVVELRNEWELLSKDIAKKKEQQKISKRKSVSSTIKTVLNYFFSGKYTLDEDTFRLNFKKSPLEKNQAKDVLSEGEKNIVAFAYYIGDAHLRVNIEEDYEKLFFIIDDPISSMDFSHVYTLSGVIRDIGKILDKLKRDKFIIFTHNNDFMRVLTSNNIVSKKLMLKKNELIDFNNNLTVPYIHHLIDVYEIARKGVVPSHTTANSIRHIIETMTKFENIHISDDGVSEYIRNNIPNEAKSYTLINDLSHGGWRTEQSPIADDDYIDICETLITHIEDKYSGQIVYCENICK